MGRVKTQLVKRVTAQLVRKHGEEFKDNFKENKEVIGRFINIGSKKIKYTIAVYVTRIVNSRKD